MRGVVIKNSSNFNLLQNSLRVRYLKISFFSQRKEEKENWETVKIGEKKRKERKLSISGSGMPSSQGYT